jgi:hypothetical protein
MQRVVSVIKMYQHVRNEGLVSAESLDHEGDPKSARKY